MSNPVVVRGDIEGSFDRISYDKGAQVLWMFEAWLTEERFREGVRTYLKRHAGGNATSQDFFAALGEAAGKRDYALKAFANFIEQSGVPLVDVSLQCRGKTIAVGLSQQRLRPLGSNAPEREWTTPACFRYGIAGKAYVQCTEVTNPAREVPLAEARACPDWLLANAGGLGYYVARYDAALGKRLLAQAAKLPEREATALASDAAVLAESGLLTLDAALEWSDALLAHPSPVVRHAAVKLLFGLKAEWLNPKQQRRKKQVSAQRLQPLARGLGWVGKAQEPEAVGTLRIEALKLAAELETDGKLRAEARTLALRWIEDAESVPAATVEAILDTAARFADGATYERLEAAALATQDRRHRRSLQAALAKVRDPMLRARAFLLAVEGSGGAGRMEGRDALLFVDDALEDEANRRAAFAFLRQNYDALVAKVPAEATSNFIRPLGLLCTRTDREAFTRFFGERAAKLPGGERRYRQALERIELCVAAREAASPVATVRPAAIRRTLKTK